MGFELLDQYSILHFSVGILWKYYGGNLASLTIVHALFEFFENSPQGIDFINNYFPFWPGGKSGADTELNQASDVVFSIIGWLIMDKLPNDKKPMFEKIMIGIISYFWIFSRFDIIPTIIFSVIGIFISINYFKKFSGLFYGILFALSVNQTGIFLNLVDD